MHPKKQVTDESEKTYLTDKSGSKIVGHLSPRLPAGTQFSWNYRDKIKRWFDLLFSVATLPLALPFSLITAGLIKLDSKGPVLIRVKRLGQGGTDFYKYKFRTMVPDAEQVLKRLLESDSKIRAEYLSTYKIANDPRITRFGKWLRKTSLDELPQILNVVKGEMSWVGPRDILDTELAMYGEFGEKLLTVQPGITGLWQVSGRSKLPYAERVRLDSYYIDNISLFLDLKIILKTVPVVLLGDGAK
jgi:lipopolysaccharide/colanic/teichoic acid biosynthesis glycosyltransferase